MNRSKLMATTALASVMAASAANAEMSISGLYAGTITDAGGGGMASGFSSNSIYVSYSDSMDNGMGVSVAMSLTAAGLLTDVNFDTGMGVIGLGNGQDSSADKLDGSPACFSLNVCGAAEVAGGYNDGDSLSGDSMMYTNSIAGWTVKVSRGEGVKSAAATAGVMIDNDDASAGLIAIPASYDAPTGFTRLSGTASSEGHDPVMSYAVKGSMMGATIAAGLSTIDYKGTTADKDPSFVTVGYSLAGMSLGYAMYDGDNGVEETQYGVGTSMAGMDVGVQFVSQDNTSDTDMTRVSVSKGMGAASFGLDYTETDLAGGDTGDSTAWNFMYVVGF
ncbi:porin [Pelagibacterales bacterium SAG-MED32]|nr:porin [Pelagibacterales bacterium SAG-MED32]